MSSASIPWPHSPPHRLSQPGVYFLTAGTYARQHFFRGAHRLDVLHRGLLRTTHRFGWRLEAWAVFSNHYHFVAHSPVDQGSAENLRSMLGQLHASTARWVNRLDRTAARHVWHNFRDTRLTYPRSYLARLKYVHHNAVKHGLVTLAHQYPWCSARWFERTASTAQVQSLNRFKTDHIHVVDDYEPANEW